MEKILTVTDLIIPAENLVQIALTSDALVLTFNEAVRLRDDNDEHSVNLPSTQLLLLGA